MLNDAVAEKNYEHCTNIVWQIMCCVCLERVRVCVALPIRLKKETRYDQCHYLGNLSHVREVATFVPISKWYLRAYQRSINNSTSNNKNLYKIDETSLPESWPNLFAERIRKRNKTTSTRHTHSIKRWAKQSPKFLSIACFVMLACLIADEHAFADIVGEMCVVSVSICHTSKSKFKFYWWFFNF